MSTINPKLYQAPATRLSTKINSPAPTEVSVKKSVNPDAKNLKSSEITITYIPTAGKALAMANNTEPNATTAPKGTAAPVATQTTNAPSTVPSGTTAPGPSDSRPEPDQNPYTDEDKNKDKNNDKNKMGGGDTVADEVINGLANNGITLGTGAGDVTGVSINTGSWTFTVGTVSVDDGPFCNHNGRQGTTTGIGVGGSVRIGRRHR